MNITCQKCNLIKNEIDFAKKNRTRDNKRGLCKSCKSLIDKDYRKRNKKKLAEYFKELWKNPERRKKNRITHNKQRYGIENIEILAQNKNCIICNMSNEEHLAKWKTRLLIHHKDNKGRHNQRIGLKPNNDINNLIFICRRCHPKLDNKFQDYFNRGKKIWEIRRRNGK